MQSNVFLIVLLRGKNNVLHIESSSGSTYAGVSTSTGTCTSTRIDTRDTRNPVPVEIPNISCFGTTVPMTRETANVAGPVPNDSPGSDLWRLVPIVKRGMGG